MTVLAQMQATMAPEKFKKFVAIRRRIIGHRPLVIGPLSAFHRAVLSVQYAR